VIPFFTLARRIERDSRVREMGRREKIWKLELVLYMVAPIVLVAAVGWLKEEQTMAAMASLYEPTVVAAGDSGDGDFLTFFYFFFILGIDCCTVIGLFLIGFGML